MEQATRTHKLLKNKNTKWRVSDEDLWQNKHYDEYLSLYDEYMNATNDTYAPWYIIDATNKKLAQLQVLETLMSCIQERLEHEKQDAPLIDNVFEMREKIHLEDYDLSVNISEETYRRELKNVVKN